MPLFKTTAVASSGMLWEEPVTAPHQDSAGLEGKEVCWKEEGHGKIIA